MRKLNSDISVRHLEYFITSAEHGSFRKAAAILCVQESSVSRRIRDVEDQIGASLFVRHPGGINLTVAGQRFLRRARQALDHICDGAAEVAAIGRAEGGYLKVGLFSSLSSGFLAELFQKYDARYGTVHVDFAEGEAHSHIAAICQFQLDVAFVIGISDWEACDTAYLWSERVLVALPEDHVLTGMAELTWKHIRDERFIIRDTAAASRIRDYLVRRIREVGCEPRIEPQRVGRYKLLKFVASGRGLTLVLESEGLIKIPGVTFRPLGGEFLDFYAVWSPRNDNPAFLTLLSLARTIARSVAVPRLEKTDEPTSEPSQIRRPSR